MTKEIEAIFYDLGGTLRHVQKDAAFQEQAKRRIAELCGTTEDPDAFIEFLNYRYEGYRKWCFDKMREAPEEELWTKWLTPDYPRERILQNALELTVEYRNVDGRRIVAKNGRESIRELYDNGYILGIISNLVTSIEIPNWLEEDHLTPYFKAVLLSCVEGLRKPDPAFQLLACERVGIPPERCAYIGDNLNRDVEGTRKAGYGMFVLYTTPEKLEKLLPKINDENRPDAIIFDFAELKEIFPKYPTVNEAAIRRV